MELRTAFARVGLAAALAVLGTPSAARAQPSGDDVVVARETFRAGEAAYKRGDFETAANSFEVSHRLAPHPFTMFNAGLAWDKAGEPARAADAFHRAIHLGGLGDDQRAKATARLEALREELATVDVQGPEDAEIAVAHLERGTPPLVVHLPPGEHRVVARHPGAGLDDQRITVAAGDATIVTFAPPPEAPEPPLTPGSDSPRGLAASGPNGLFIGGWVALGLGAAAGGAAVGLGVAALSARDDFEASSNTDANARDRAATLRTVTNVMWGVAGAGVATGTILLVLGWDDADDAEGDSLGLDLGPGHLGLRGRF